MNPTESSPRVAVLGDERALVVVRAHPGRRLPDSTVGVVALGGALVVAALLTALGGHGRPTLSLAVMAVTVAAVCWWARPLLAPLVGAIAWLVLDGFVTDLAGQLGWHGEVDVLRIVVLTGTGLVAGIVRAGVIRLGRRVLVQEFSIDQRQDHRLVPGGAGR